MPRSLTTTTVFESEFDDEEVELLLEYCVNAGMSPSQAISRLVREVLLDDAAAHRPVHHLQIN